MADYSQMTTDDFSRTLLQVLAHESRETILLVPGVYECLAEHYNNVVLDRWADEHPALAWPEG